MSTRRKMANSAIKHQVFLQRYAGTHAKQLIAFVNQLGQTVQALIPNTDNPLTKARYVKVVKSFQQISKALQKDTNKGIMNDLSELVSYEADFTKRIIDQSVNTDKVPFETAVPSTAQLHSAAFTSVMDSSVPNLGLTGGLTVGDALENYGSKIASSIVQTVRQGYALGSTTNQIAQQLEDYVGQPLLKSQAQSVTRTITNYLASTAREEVYKTNDDIITGYQVVATLDNRTTLTCAALDGQVFDKDDFDKPPYHWNCRTTYIGIVDKKYSISFPDATRPAKGAEGTESTPATSTYNSWLKTQPDSFQDEVLGPERAKLFREGASVQSFVDENYTPYTLDQLKAKDGEHN